MADEASAARGKSLARSFGHGLIGDLKERSMKTISRRAFVATAAVSASLASSRTLIAQEQTPAPNTTVPAETPAAAPHTQPAPAKSAAPLLPKGPFKQPPLPFDEAALDPVIGQRTVALHYLRHHASYYNNLNAITPGTKYAKMSLEEIIIEGDNDVDKRFFNNAGQAWNHERYWESLNPGGPAVPNGRLAQLIYDNFGSVADLKEKMIVAAANLFGSGWTWLAQDGSKLRVMNTNGGDSPLTFEKTPLLGIDVWEHAYYLDYENRRPEHVKALLDKLVNWDVVASRLK
jgi:Fe-Mn family superoxide dismutase